MDIRLIFRNYYWFINEGTHPSIFRALLDWRRDIEKVRQENPFDITLRYFWNFGVSQGNEIKQGAGKIFYTVHITLHVTFTQNVKLKNQNAKCLCSLRSRFIL